MPAFRLLRFDQAAGQKLELIVGFPQLVLGTLSLGDILKATDRANHGAFRVAERHDVR